jgi:hypothetical protein
MLSDRAAAEQSILKHAFLFHAAGHRRLFGRHKAPKMLELLREVVPTAATMAALVNPKNPNADTWSTSLQTAARTLGLDLNVLSASSERDIDKAFATLIPMRVGGLVIVNDVFLITREEQIFALALRYKLPTIFQRRGAVLANGLRATQAMNRTPIVRPAYISAVFSRALASEPGIGRVWAAVVRVSGPHREGEKP